MSCCNLWERKRQTARDLGISDPNDPNEWLGVPFAILRRTQLLSEDKGNVIYQLNSLRKRGIIASEMRKGRCYIRLTKLGKEELERMVGSFDEQIFFHSNG